MQSRISIFNIEKTIIERVAVVPINSLNSRKEVASFCFPSVYFDQILELHKDKPILLAKALSKNDYYYD